MSYSSAVTVVVVISFVWLISRQILIIISQQPNDHDNLNFNSQQTEMSIHNYKTIYIIINDNIILPITSYMTCLYIKTCQAKRRMSSTSVSYHIWTLYSSLLGRFCKRRLYVPISNVASFDALPILSFTAQTYVSNSLKILNSAVYSIMTYTLISHPPHCTLFVVE